MSDEKLTPDRAVRLLRAKAGELENMVLFFRDPPPPDPAATGEALAFLMADISLVAQLLADEIERTENRFNLLLETLEKMTSTMAELSALVRAK